MDTIVFEATVNRYKRILSRFSASENSECFVIVLARSVELTTRRHAAETVRGDAERLIRLCRSIPHPSALPLRVIGDYFALLGNFNTATCYLTKALNVAETTASLPDVLNALTQFAVIEARRSDHKACVNYLKRACDLSQSLNVLTQVATYECRKSSRLGTLLIQSRVE